MSPTISVSCAGRRSLQGSGMNIESDKHVQVTLPDHQVKEAQHSQPRVHNLWTAFSLNTNLYSHTTP